MQKPSNNLFVVGNARTAASVEITQSQDNYGSPLLGYYSTANNIYADSHIPWGPNDDLPNTKMKMLQINPNKMQLVLTVRDFVVGDGVGIFKTTPNPETGELDLKPYFSPAIQKWIRQNRIDQYISDAAFQQAFSGNVFTNFSYNRRTSEVSLSALDAFVTRLAAPKTAGKKPTSYVLNPYFGLEQWNAKHNSIGIAAFDPTNPTQHLESIWHGKDEIPGQPHYAFKPWWFSDKWTTITDLIAQFHISGLKNGYNIKYHIRIPEEYYEKFGETHEERELNKQKMQANLDTWLAGVENVNKSMITHYLAEAHGGKALGVEIIELKNNLPDDAYTTLFKTANETQVSAHGLLPILGGVATDSKLGASGSAIRLSAEYHESYRTRTDRTILYEPLRFAADIMGWDDDIVFYSKRIPPAPTLDKVPQEKRMN